MKRKLEVLAVPEAQKASRRPKTVTVKTLSSETGGKRKVFSLDGNSASFGEDFLYAFKANVKAARKKTRERRAALAAGKTVA